MQEPLPYDPYEPSIFLDLFPLGILLITALAIGFGIISQRRWNKNLERQTEALERIAAALEKRG